MQRRRKANHPTAAETKRREASGPTCRVPRSRTRRGILPEEKGAEAEMVASRARGPKKVTVPRTSARGSRLTAALRYSDDDPMRQFILGSSFCGVVTLSSAKSTSSLVVFFFVFLYSGINYGRNQMFDTSTA